MTAVATTTRFELLRRLGEGAAGVVYEALDRARGKRVAIKTLRSITPESLARLQGELRAVQNVHHPNLVTLGEIAHEGDQTFLTMELVEGTDFLEHVRRRSGGAGDSYFDEARLRDGLRQLAEGLTALHEAGLVHRDVKPSNVRVTREGRVVLLDFGLVIDEAAVSSWTAHATAGTPAYMAPEQAVSGQVGPEADWYATGVLLFEALTGRVPFEGPPLQVVMRKQKEEAPAPSTIAGGIPPDLDALCVAFLRFDPQARPKDRHVLRSLGSTAGAAWRNALQTQETRFVGRSAELESLASALRDTQRVAPVTLVVEGESGVGKSALVQRFAQQLALEQPEAVVLAGRCYAEDASCFQGVSGIVESLADFLASLETTQARALAPAKTLPLVKMFPALRRVEAIAELARRPQPVSSVLVGMRARAFEGFRELLSGIGSQRPLILAVHDAQWLDADSLALLRDLIRPPHAPRLLLILTARTGMPVLSGETRRVVLGALPQEDARALAAGILAQGEVTDPVAAERCAGHARGEPFAIDITALHARHAVANSKGQLSVDDVIGSVLQELDSAPRTLLETIAVAGAPLPSDTIARAAGVDGNHFARSLSMLRVMHLAQSTGPSGSERVGLHHDRVGTAVLGWLGSRRTEELHRRLAVALETSETRDLHSLTTHWRAAGDRKQVAHYAALAGDEGVERLAFERAARYYELALASATAPDDQRLALLVRLGEARSNAGMGQAASEAFAEAAEGTTGLQSLDLHRRAADELYIAGDYEAGTQKLRDVAKRVRMWMPWSLGSTIAALVVFRLMLWLRGMRFQLRDEDSIAPGPITRIWACAAVARRVLRSDPILAHYFQTRMLLFALRCGSAYGLSYAISHEAIFRAARGVRTRARAGELLALADELAQRSGKPRAKTLTAYARGSVALMHGRPGEAVAHLDQAVALALDSTSSDYMVTHWLQLESLSARALTGDIKELSRRLQSLLHESLDRGDIRTRAAVDVLPGLSRGWLCEGDSRAFRSRIEEAMSRKTQLARNLQHWASSALTEVDLYEGLGRQAIERVSSDFSRAKRAFKFVYENLHIPARQLRGRSAILAAAQEPLQRERARLLRAAARDARWLRKAPPDYAHAWAAVVESGVFAIRGERKRAIAALQEAIAGLDATQDRYAAACARMRLGAFLGAGDEEGRALIAEGEAYMREQGVVDPLRTAAAIVPGVDPT